MVFSSMKTLSRTICNEDRPVCGGATFTRPRVRRTRTSFSENPRRPAFCIRSWATCCSISIDLAVAVPFAFRATFSPGRSNELVELFTHHGFYHDPNGALGESTQVLMEYVLFW